MKKKQIIEKCPTCGAGAEVKIYGLDLVAQSGDETLATKSYKHIPADRLEQLLQVSEDIKDKFECLLGYLDLWYRQDSPPSELIGVIEEAREWLQSPYLMPPGFEHLPNDVEESGTATDHTVIPQPISEEKMEIAFAKAVDWAWIRTTKFSLETVAKQILPKLAKAALEELNK